MANPPSAKTIAYLAPVHQWLESGAPHITEKEIGFNMGSFLDSDDGAHDSDFKECGTACCIAGAVTVFSQDGENLYHRSNPEDVYSGYVMNVGFNIGLTEQETSMLFFGLDHRALRRNSPMPEYVQFASAELGARVLRTFLETGVIDWNV